MSAEHEPQLCGASALGGGSCELNAGHDGKHSRTWANGGVFSWTDASQLELVRQFEAGYGSRRNT